MDGKIRLKTSNPESKLADRRDDDDDVDRTHAEHKKPRARISSATHTLGRFGWRLVHEDDKTNPSTSD